MFFQPYNNSIRRDNMVEHNNALDRIARARAEAMQGALYGPELQKTIYETQMMADRADASRKYRELAKTMAGSNKSLYTPDEHWNRSGQAGLGAFYAAQAGIRPTGGGSVQNLTQPSTMGQRPGPSALRQARDVAMIDQRNQKDLSRQGFKQQSSLLGTQGDVQAGLMTKQADANVQQDAGLKDTLMEFYKKAREEGLMNALFGSGRNPTSSGGYTWIQ